MKASRNSENKDPVERAGERHTGLSEPRIHGYGHRNLLVHKTNKNLKTNIF